MVRLSIFSVPRMTDEVDLAITRNTFNSSILFSLHHKALRLGVRSSNYEQIEFLSSYVARGDGSVFLP